MLPIAPSSYYEQKARQADPGRLPARARRDAALTPEITRVWQATKRGGVPQVVENGIG
jgi:putative transposase